VIDIETAPLELYAWTTWKVTASLEQIKTDWSILSFAALWMDKPSEIIYMDTGGRGARKVRDDRKLMRPLWKLLDEADIVVAQNGKKFDIRKIKARLIAHGFKPPSPFHVIDTLIVGDKNFAFTSQKLKYTSGILAPEMPKDEHKQFPGQELWTECLADNPKAWKVMRKYNTRDIKSTRKVYLKMRPYIENHPQMGLYFESDRPRCPNCGSLHVVRDKQRLQAKTASMYVQYQCRKCGKYCRGKAMKTKLSKRRSLLV
jgi:hypothetical protein